MKIRKKYKFTDKTHSVRAIVALLVAAVSFLGFILIIRNSVNNTGNGSVYLGAAGMFSMIAALVSLYFGISAVREEDTFRILPMAGMVSGALACLLWVGIYVLGFRI